MAKIEGDIGYVVEKNRAFGYYELNDIRFCTWRIDRGNPVAEIYDGSKCECVMFKEPIACLRPKGWKIWID